MREMSFVYILDEECFQEVKTAVLPKLCSERFRRPPSEPYRPGTAAMSSL